MCYNALDPTDGLRDGELFLTEFFRSARRGRNLRQSFEEASQHVAEFTAEASSSNGATGAPQTPVLDDNADGVPGSGELTGLDGLRSRDHILGFGVSNPALPVGWLKVTRSFAIDLGDPVGLRIVAQPGIGGRLSGTKTETTEYKGEIGSRFLDDHLDVLQVFGRQAGWRSKTTRFESIAQSLAAGKVCRPHSYQEA